MRSIIVIALGMVAGSGLLANPGFDNLQLQTLKQGNSGDKTWAVLEFSDNAAWSGVSRSKEGEMALIFQGLAGDLDGTNLLLSTEFDRSVSVHQLTGAPPAFRVSFSFEPDIPVVVARHGKNVVVSFNDPRLLEVTPQTATPFESESASLTSVSTVGNDGKRLTNVNFDTTFDWIGYIQYNQYKSELLLNGIRNVSSQNPVLFEDGGLRGIYFRKNPEKPFLYKATVVFDAGSRFFIGKRNKMMFIQHEPGEPSSAPEPQFAEALPAVTGTADIAQDSQAGPISDSDFDDLFSSEPTVQEQKPAGEVAAVSRAQTDTSAPAAGQTTVQRPKPEIMEPEPEPVEIARTEPAFQPPSEEPKPQQEISRASLEEDNDIFWNQRVSFDFRSTPIQDALRLLASSNGLNMVIGEKIEGTVTMQLHDVTLRQALEAIVVTNNYEYFVEDGIITVKTVSEKYEGGRITKVYRLMYADASNVAQVVKRIATNDSLVQVFYPEYLQFMMDPSEMQQGGGAGGGMQYQGAGMSRMMKNSEAIEGIRRASVLVVTDRPDIIREVDQLIVELDVPARQIVIEAKFYELTPETSDELGINWQDTWNVVNSLSNGAGSLSLENNGALGVSWDWRSGNLSPGQYYQVLQMLQTQKESKIINHPKLLAMDNEEASISVGTTVPIPSLTSRAGLSDQLSYEFKEINIQLNVVPHIGKDNYITMYVNPIVEQITGWVESGTVRVPITGKRAINSIVKVRDGNTVVVGGLITDSEIETRKRVWLLGRLPLIGKLFQQTVKEKVKTDLLIFITPKIVSV